MATEVVNARQDRLQASGGGGHCKVAGLRDRIGLLVLHVGWCWALPGRWHEAGGQ